jgi:hypothetical protein
VIPFVVVSWNAKANRDADDVERALRTLLKDERPHALSVSEAGGYGTAIDRAAEAFGYRRLQLPRAPKRDGRLEEDANLAVLVRSDVVVLRARPWRMRQSFRGAVHDWPHQPRVYWRGYFRIPRSGKVRASFGHWPTEGRGNDAACHETERKVSRWFRLSRKPSVHVGDLNRRWTWLRDHIKGARVIVGHGVDHALVKGVEGRATVLGSLGSDHRAIRYEFRADR